MKKWTEHLNQDVYERLCNCRSRKSDLTELVNAKWLSYKETGKDKEGFTKEDALVAVLELLECNNQDFGAELAIEEYDELVRG